MENLNNIDDFEDKLKSLKSLYVGDTADELWASNVLFASIRSVLNLIKKSDTLSSYIYDEIWESLLSAIEIFDTQIKESQNKTVILDYTNQIQPLWLKHHK